MELDNELVKKIKELKLEYGDQPQSELLIKIPNRNKGINYRVKVETDEFTSICPLNISQPDYATITLTYIPDDWIVELKSLKFYLTSFRSVKVFHEDVPAMIMKALSELLIPEFMQIEGLFTIRGGIETTVTADYFKER